MSASPRQRVRITYTSPGIQPPVFVAGAFTDPPWQPCEMEQVKPLPDATIDPEGKADYSFFKEFNVPKGSWQYKFRLGPGDWWACDETAEIGWLNLALLFVDLLTSIVTDDAGNRNNVLVVSPDDAEYPHTEKYAHARPFHRNDDSSHGTVWEVLETNLEPQNASAGGKHQKHSHTKGHFNPQSSKEGSGEDVQDALPGATAVVRHSPLAHSKASVEDTDDDVPAMRSFVTPTTTGPAGSSEVRHVSAAVDSSAGLASPRLSALRSKDKSPVLILTEADTEIPDLSALGLENSLNSNSDVAVPSIVVDNEAHGDRKMSSLEIETVKLLMSMPNPTGPSSAIMAGQDGNILEIDTTKPDYSAAWISPGLERNVHSHAPLLSHECLTCLPESSFNGAGDDEPQSRKQSNSSDEHNADTDGPPTPDDFDSPHIERFPSGAKDILQRIATLQKEIPPDEAIVFEDDHLNRSPSFVTREAPTFPHEMPPIGSPAALRRKASSMDSPQFSGDAGRWLHLPP